MNARRREGRDRQRGAIGLFGALVMLMVVAVAALALDAGRLYVEKRRLQIVADQAAINAANQTGYCGYNGQVSLDELKIAAQASAANHGYKGNLIGEEGSVLLGVADAVGGVRSFTPTEPARADSVYVKARTTVPASLMAGGFLGGGSVSLQAEAAARRPVRATISAGSGLAEVDLNESILDSLLGGLLGTVVNLDLGHYQGLLRAQVSLLDLLGPAADIGLGVGTVDELLETDISVLQLLDLLATVADEQNLAAVKLALAELPLPPIETGGLQLKLGDVLSLGVANGQEAVDAKVNVLDILLTGLQVANKDHFIAMDIGVALPGLVGEVVNVGLTIIEPPQIAVGRPGLDAAGNPRTKAHTAQIRLQVGVPLQLNLGIVQAKVDLAVMLEVASADARLDSLHCGNYPDFRQQVRLQARSALLNLGIGAIPPPPPAAPPDIEHLPPATVAVTANTLLLGTTPVATVLVGATPYAGSSQEAQLDYSVTLAELKQGPVVQEDSVSVGDSVATALERLDLTLDVSLLGLPPLLQTLGVSGLIDGLLSQLIPNLLRPLLDALDDVLLDPLLQALGVQVGVVDAALVDVDLDEAQLVY